LPSGVRSMKVVICAERLSCRKDVRRLVRRSGGGRGCAMSRRRPGAQMRLGCVAGALVWVGKGAGGGKVLRMARVYSSLEPRQLEILWVACLQLVMPKHFEMVNIAACRRQKRSAMRWVGAM
jgi:hypothetical protein